MSAAKLEIHYNEEQDWCALYVNGRFECSGDHYYIEEKALRMAGVKCVYNEDYMLGDGSGQNLAKNLTEIAEYRRELDKRTEEAEALRAEAQLLLDKAKELTTTPFKEQT